MIDITPEEFGKLFIEYKDKFTNIAASYVRDETVAADIVSECFMTFWEKRNKITITSVPEAYIITSVKNRCLNYLRDKANHMRIEQNIYSNKYASVVTEINMLKNENLEHLFSSEIATIFLEYIDSMPEITKKIFYASRFENLTYNEIAEKYHVTPRKVKREIQKVLKAMRVSLKDYLPFIIYILLSENTF